jgi:hypothetical protein
MDALYAHKNNYIFSNSMSFAVLSLIALQNSRSLADIPVYSSKLPVRLDAYM